MFKKKNIVAVTGIRSEYDILYPIIKVLQESGKFNVKLVVSGAHLSDWHGNTLEKIEEDGFEIVEKIDNLLMTNRKTQRVKGIGLLTYSLSQTVDREKPDFLLVVGDREESIATALVGNYMDVLTVHVAGGDPVYGNSDDPIRFAVSKLSHIHFTFAQEYANNLIRMSEDEFRVHFVGNTSYYNIQHTPEISMNELSSLVKCNLEKKKYLVFIKHPLSSEKEDSYEQMKISLKALERFAIENQIKVIGSYPNTDPGSYDILKAIDEYSHSKWIKFYKTLPRTPFINLLRNAIALVGNSSMGILEAPFYKLPVVNIGNRQRGRLNAGNVEFVDYNEEKIITALQKACFDQSYREKIYNLSNPYGDEKAPEKILNILLSIDLNDKKWYIKNNLC